MKYYFLFYCNGALDSSLEIARALTIIKANIKSKSRTSDSATVFIKCLMEAVDVLRLLQLR